MPIFITGLITLNSVRTINQIIIVTLMNHMQPLKPHPLCSVLMCTETKIPVISTIPKS